MVGGEIGFQFTEMNVEGTGTVLPSTTKVRVS